MSRILALDLSLARTGVAVLDDGVLVDHGIIITSDRDPRHRRLGDLAADVSAVLCKHVPGVMAIETSSGWQRMSNNSRASIEALAQARGAVLVAADGWIEAGNEMRIVEVDCHEVREVVCGNRAASKAQVQENLRLRGYELPSINGRVQGDIADALAIAAYIWSHERLLSREELKGYKENEHHDD